MERPKLVVITWDDAFSGPQHWVTLEEYSPEPVTPVTVGWLIPRFLNGYVTTADSYMISNDSIQYYGVGHIPEGMVKSLTFIDVKEVDE